MTKELSDVERQLLELEHRGWEALSSGRGADYYDEILAEDASMVVPIGVMDRAASLDAMRAAPPWSRFEIQESNIRLITSDSALITYRAVAQRETQPEYSAWITSDYVRCDGRWQMVLHQQTPLPPR